MAATLIIKHSTTASAVPVTGDLEAGELAINLADRKIYSKRPDGTVVLLSDGTLVGGGGGSTVLSTVEVNLGSVPKRSGKFTISGVGLTTGKPVHISKAVGPYTGKGTRADEAEMDAVQVSATVTGSTTITAYWNSPSPVKGNLKFDYFVGA